MLLAATEVATNAIHHGGRRRSHVGNARGRFVCEILDRGDCFDDPAAGYLAPREGVGTGLWVTRPPTWQIECFRSPTGFTTRVWRGRRRTPCRVPPRSPRSCARPPSLLLVLSGSLG